MRTIGTIPTPITKVEKVIAPNDEAVLDALFDLKIPRMPEALTVMNKQDQPAMTVMKSLDTGIVALLLFKPPLPWHKYKNQRYQLFIAPDIDHLKAYFRTRLNRTGNTFDRNVLSAIVKYIEIDYKRIPH